MRQFIMNNWLLIVVLVTAFLSLICASYQLYDFYFTFDIPEQKSEKLWNALHTVTGKLMLESTGYTWGAVTSYVGFLLLACSAYALKHQSKITIWIPIMTLILAVVSMVVLMSLAFKLIA